MKIKLILGLLFGAAAFAEDHDGWIAVPTAPPVTIAPANAGRSVSALSLSGPSPLAFTACTPQISAGNSTNVAELVTPEITALAANLENDPKRIYDFVHNYIRYVHYFDCKKGSLLTLLEGSGNDFDQCALLVALLRAASTNSGITYTVTYQFGAMQMPYQAADNLDLMHWLGITLPPNNFNDYFYLLHNFNYQRGYPRYTASDYVLYTSGDVNHFTFHRVWVKLVSGGNTYYLDPAFKISTPIASQINLTNAMQLSSASFLASAAINSFVSTDYVSNINYVNIGGNLTTYSSNLVAYLQNTVTNLSVEQALSGYAINETTTQTFSDPPFSPVCGSFLDQNGTSRTIPVFEWTNIPDAYMAHIQMWIPNEINVTYPFPGLRGQKLTLTFNTTNAFLGLDDVKQFSSSSQNTSSSVIMTNAISHPYGVWDYSLNQVSTPYRFPDVKSKSYSRSSSGYVIAYGFDNPNGQLVRRQKMLASLLRQAGVNLQSSNVVTETLNVMGEDWLQQTYLAELALSSAHDTLPFHHHRVGRVAQETGSVLGYYIDVFQQMSGGVWRAGNPFLAANPSMNVFTLGSFFWSALEHGAIEQQQKNPSASTVKTLYLANSNGQKLILGTQGNAANVYSLLSQEPIASRYTSAQTNVIFGELQSPNYTSVSMLLPSGIVHVGTATPNWNGYGFAESANLSGGSFFLMSINGQYSGGIGGNPVWIDPIAENNDYVTAPSTVDPGAPSQSPPTSPDPASMLDGSFSLDSSDLVVGQPEPRGLVFARHYDSNRRYSNPASMANGWTHRYAMTVTKRSDAAAALGQNTTQEMAPYIAAMETAYQIFTGTPDVTNPSSKRWAVTALIAEWAIDQLTNNAASVTLGSDSIQFIKRPDGGYIAPAGISHTLTTTGGLYDLQQRNGNKFHFNSANQISSITDPNGKIMTFAYDSSSRLTNVTDCWTPARSLTLNYTGSPARLTSVSDSTGRPVSLNYANTYSSDGDLTSFQDAATKTWNYEYDTDHKILKTKEPTTSRVVVQNIYDSDGKVIQQLSQGDAAKTWNLYIAGRMAALKDPSGGRTVYRYDEHNRLVGLIDATTNASIRIYDGQDHVIQTVTPKNETNQFVYDGNQNLLKVIDPLLNVATNGYDTASHLTNQMDFRGNRTTFIYNLTTHQLLSITAPNVNNDPTMSNIVQFAYNADGTVANTTDQDGKVTTFPTYDSYGQPTRKNFPISPDHETYSWSARGDLLSTTDANNISTTNNYNNLRQLTSTTVLRAGGNVLTQYIYDDQANLWKVIDPNGNTTANTYSSTKKLVATVFPVLPSGLSPSVTNTFDNRDWLQTKSVLVMTGLAALTQSGYDPDGHLISLADPLSHTNFYRYDGDGWMTNAQTPLRTNQTTSYAYDGRGKRIMTTDAATFPIKFGYDGNGNLLTTTNRNSGVFLSSYYNDNRVWTNQTPSGKATTLTYNKRGLVASIKKPSQQGTGNQTTFAYDDRGRLINRADPLFTSIFTYDANNNLLTHTENGLVIKRSYDELNRLRKYTNELGDVIQYDYDNNGNLTNLVYPGGTKRVAYGYDSNNRLTSVLDWAGRTTSFSYDFAGRLINTVRPNGSKRVVIYDLAGQATNIQELGPNGMPLAYFKMMYDEAGRMTNEFIAPLPTAFTEGTQTSIYDSDNRLFTFNSTPVTHDFDGNMTVGPLNSSSAITHVYDMRNRLTSVGASGSAPALSYGYDSEGNRTSVTQGAQTTQYTIDPASTLSRVLMRKVGSATTYYVYGPGLLYEVDASENTKTYHYDARGSTVAISNPTGYVTDRVEYNTYGAVTKRTGTTDTPYLYNGRYGVLTDTNGLCYMRARYYNPVLRRFLNADPSGFSGGLNFYAYADGNPVSLIDPFGLYGNPVSGMDGPVGPSTAFVPGGPFFSPSPIQMSPASYFVAGAAVGAVGTAAVVVSAPVIVSGLVAAGVSTTTASAAVTFGLGGTAIAGALAGGVNTYKAVAAGDWNTVAFNAGSLVGGLAVGVGGGGRSLAESISGKPSDVTPSWNPIADKGLAYDRNYPGGSLLTWLGSAPTPQSGGASAALTSAGVLSFLQPGASSSSTPGNWIHPALPGSTQSEASNHGK